MRTNGASYSPAVVLVVVLMAALVFSASAGGKADERYLKMTTSDRTEACDTSRPFCNECTICDRSTNPRCVCGDLTSKGCRSLCENCEQSPLLIYPPLFQCKDFNFYYCKNTCAGGV